MSLMYPQERVLLFLAGRYEALGYDKISDSIELATSKEWAYERLKQMTGQDFGYDIQAWYEWMKTTDNLSGEVILEAYEAHDAYDLGVEKLKEQNFADALSYLQRALKLYEQAKEVVPIRTFLFERMFCMSDLARAYKGIGDLEKAIEICERIVEHSQQHYKDIFIGQLASYYAAQNDNHKALELFNLKLEQVRQLGRKADEAIALLEIAKIWAIQGENLILARDYIRQAQVIFEQSENVEERLTTLADKMLAYINEQLEED